MIIILSFFCVINNFSYKYILLYWEFEMDSLMQLFWELNWILPQISICRQFPGPLENSVDLQDQESKMKSLAISMFWSSVKSISWSLFYSSSGLSRCLLLGPLGVNPQLSHQLKRDSTPQFQPDRAQQKPWKHRPKNLKN